MNSLPTPPESPELESLSLDNSSPLEAVICGTCNKTLGVGWFCSDCHRKCVDCNRFLCQDDEYCSRCWTFDPIQQQLIRKHDKRYSSSAFIRAFIQQQYYRNIAEFSLVYPYHTLIPSPSNSTGSESRSHNETNDNDNNNNSNMLS
ncbi:MAG: hypothetical protein EXX96DRAFT_539473 [Benjaminiella poitrasii]|nr:MAG: hypothetical protein EXX96DRAFT_539473 [Benjaminiella poitrasii]